MPLANERRRQRLQRDHAGTPPPSDSQRMPNLASQIRVAFPSMASKHRLQFAGELEMTFSTSEVAVCCSSELRAAR